MEVVRPLREEDLPGAAATHLACWREAYVGVVPEVVLQGLQLSRFQSTWNRIWDVARSGHLVAVVDGEVVGFAGTRPCRDEQPVRDLELWGIYLLQAHHGSGLAPELLEGVLQQQPASLWVFEANARARAFYAKHGFVDDGARQSHDEFGGAVEVRMVR